MAAQAGVAGCVLDALGFPYHLAAALNISKAGGSTKNQLQEQFYSFASELMANRETLLQGPAKTPVRSANMTAALYACRSISKIQKAATDLEDIALEEAVWDENSPEKLVCALSKAYVSHLTKHKKGDFFSGLYQALDSQLGRGKNQASCVTLDSVIGLDRQKMLATLAVINPLTRHMEYRNLGGHPPSGAIFYGPPGSGKTMLARSIAASFDTDFISGPELLNKWLGDGAKKLRGIYDGARPPHLIVIDEAGEVFQEKNDAMGKYVQDLSDTMQVSLDRAEDIGGVSTILTTNRFDTLKKALKDRMPYHVFFPEPDPRQIRAVLEHHASKIPCVDFDPDDYIAFLSAASLRHVKNFVFTARDVMLSKGRTRITKEDFAESMRIITDRARGDF